MRTKISAEEMIRFEYKFHNGEFPHERFGQAFFNYFWDQAGLCKQGFFGKLDEHDVFHRRDWKSLQALLWESFVEGERS